MSAHYRYIKISISVVAWSGVLLVATYRSHTPVVFGKYGWVQVMLLGLLGCTAVMAEYLTSDIVNSWAKKSSLARGVIQLERGMSRARSMVTEVQAFSMRLPQVLSEARSYFVYLFVSCKRVTRHLISSGSHL